eukprot:1220301-Pyramimonas_sp.AAC.1
MAGGTWWEAHGGRHMMGGTYGRRGPRWRVTLSSTSTVSVTYRSCTMFSLRKCPGNSFAQVLSPCST